MSESEMLFAVIVLLSILCAFSFAIGSMTCEMKTLRQNSDRYLAIRRRNVTVDNGRILLPDELDKEMDSLVLADAIEKFCGK